VTIDEFVAQVERKRAPAPLEELQRFEALIGYVLPDDYRHFLIQCNGGYIGGRYGFQGKNPDAQWVEAGVQEVGGLRDDGSYSLFDRLKTYQGRIPRALIWVHDDPFGNAICLGLEGLHRGKVYFWDRENQPGSTWDGSVESADNVTLIANSFTEYVAGLARLHSD